jgi:rhombotail lipoprotein
MMGEIFSMLWGLVLGQWSGNFGRDMKTAKFLVVGVLCAGAAAWCGCETFGARSHHRATSAMKFLYPGNAERVEKAAIPVLSLPLKVGVAFVPVEEGSVRRGYFPVSDATVSEERKMELMKEVSRHFEKYPFVKSIDLIPTAYLKPGGSFANLDQLRSMFDVDVIALLAYDQVQFTDQGLLSLSYWTLVGAYLVEGEKNDTRTMLDAVVYDIASRKMLFRAPGTSHIKGAATPVNLSEELRQDSEAGFQVARTNLVTALEFQLGQFKERVKKSPEEIKVVRKPGYVGGAAALGMLEVVLMGVMGIMGIMRRELRSD